MNDRRIEIAKLSEADFGAILRISDLQFGASFIRVEQLSERVGKEDNLTAKIDGELIGYVLSQFVEPSTIDLIFNRKEVNLTRYFEKTHSICWIESIVVDPRYSGRGIGKKLIAKLMSLSVDDHQTFLSVVWKHEKGSPLETIYEGLGFKLVQHIPNYWHADSLEKGYACYYCGTPPCQCAALIYALK